MNTVRDHDAFQSKLAITYKNDLTYFQVKHLISDPELPPFLFHRSTKSQIGNHDFFFRFEVDLAAASPLMAARKALSSPMAASLP